MPNVGALRGQEADVPPVLADGVRGAAIGLELMRNLSRASPKARTWTQGQP